MRKEGTKLLSLFLAICMAVSTITISAVSVSAAVKYREGDWEYSKYGYYDVVETIKYIGASSDVQVPDKLGGLPVASIGNGTFANVSRIDSVEIPTSVASINSSFSGKAVKSVYISDLAAWCNEKFYKDVSNPLCNGADLYINGELVTELMIPDGVTSIANYAFYGCTSIESVVIPDSVTSIGNGAFSGCKNLKSVTIGENVAKIGSDAFAGCDHVETVSIGSLSTWCGIALENENAAPFSADTMLYVDGEAAVDITIPLGIQSIGKYAFANLGTIQSVVALPGVTEIEERAFYGCTGLESVVLPDGLLSISDYAFCGCTNLKGIVIPDSVTTIGVAAFSGCKNLESLTVSENTSKIGTDAFSDTKWYDNQQDGVVYIGSVLYKIKGEYLEAIEIKEGVKSITGKAFEGCEGIKSIVFPDSLTDVNSDEFDNTEWYKSLYDGVIYAGKVALKYRGFRPTSIVIKDGTKAIADYAFYECTFTKSIEIPNTVTKIGRSAFESCRALEKLTLPESLTEIGAYAFKTCTTLTEVTIPNGVTALSENCFEYCPALEKVTIGENVSSIGAYCFRNCSKMISVNIPEAIESIGEDAFFNCNKLSAANIGSIEAWLNIDFSNNESNPLFKGAALYLDGNVISKVEIPAGVTRVKKYVFIGYNQLEGVVFPDSITAIEDYAFYQCGKLKSLQLPDSVTAIGTSAFQGCSSLEKIEIPAGVTVLESYAFYGCKKLNGITIPDGVATVCEKALDDTKWYNSQPDGVVYAGKVVYRYKGEVPESVELMEGTVNITDKAFSGCNTLKSITLPDSLNGIGREAFYGCTALESVEIPASVTQIGEYALGYYRNPVDNAYYRNVRADDFVIYGTLDTSAERYAAANALTFIDINDVSTLDEPDEATKDEPTLDEPTKDEPAEPTKDEPVEPEVPTPDEPTPDEPTRDEPAEPDEPTGDEPTKDEPTKDEPTPDEPTPDQPDDPKEEIVIGDVNGDGKIDINDATLIQKYLADLEKLTDEQKAAADVNGDGKIDINDATLIQKYVAELIKEFR